MTERKREVVLAIRGVPAILGFILVLVTLGFWIGHLVA